MALIRPSRWVRFSGLPLVEEKQTTNHEEYGYVDNSAKQTDTPDSICFGYRPRPCFLAVARRARLLGRGVTAAYLTFNQAGVGSNPSDPMQSDDYRPAHGRHRRPRSVALARSSAVRAASL